MRMNSVFVFGVLAALTSTAAASSQHGTTGGLSDLPQAAQSTISAALGRDMTAYAVRKEPGGLQTENTQQHLVSTFTASELEVCSGLAIWRMNLTGYGYGTALTPVATAVPEAEGNRVQYRRGRLTEWYINGPLGLEQGFTISRPPGQSRGRELTIELALSGNLVAFEEADQQLTLKNAAREPIFRYSGLQAHDSTGRELSAKLELQGQNLLLRVNDRNARYPIVVDPWVQTAELLASDGAAGDQFGWSVSISGNTVVVGSPFHAVGLNTGQGAAYVFVEPANGWTGMTQTAELVASDGAANAFFGSSVAISGDTIVVGAGGTTVQGNPHQGAAYVFVQPANGWTNMTQTAELAASDGYVGDDFGASVAISGNTLVAGAPYASIGSNFQQGASYVFVEPSGGWTNMTQTAKLTSSDGAADDIFGDSVAVDSGTVVVGASEATVNGYGSAGKAYVFVQPGNGWTDTTQTAELTASDAAADDYFGSSVAVVGNIVVVGAPSDYAGAAYVFVEPRSGWVDTTQTAELTPGALSPLLLLGTSVGIDGSTVMAGAVGAKVGDNAYQGQLYVFLEPTQQAKGWTDESQSAQLTSSDGGAGDYFGLSLSMSGTAEVVGAPFHQVGLTEQGAAYVFQPLNSHPTETSLSPSNAIVGGPGFQLTVGGNKFVQGAVVSWNGSPRSTTFVSSTVLQAQILASDIATVGNFTVKVTNPPPGGGNSNGLIFTVQNPVPGIGSLSPDAALAGGAAFTLTVNGSNFVSTSKVYWNGTKLSTTYVSSAVLQAHVPASAIKTAGTANVTVVNPAPGGGTSNPATFYINNPVPSLTSLQPSKIKAGSSAFTLYIYGSGFVTTSQASWNGSTRTTTYAGPGKVTAQILKSDVAKAGTAQVTVANPAPGGGTSNPLTFTITK
jgi:FG-GAP repeat protein/IPT/TIG domain-containing protein